MTTLFISDLHLDPERPQITELFLRFLTDEAAQARGLYILGDLFEAWVGDDDDSPLAMEVGAALAGLAESGTACYFMRGNRDFLVGRDFARKAGIQMLPDPCVVQLDGDPTLLLHGDILCTDDQVYQAFRRQVRDPGWQEAFLQQPLPARRDFAQQARSASREHQRGLTPQIMDVNAGAVTETFQRFGVRRMIHGHTHRPKIHTLDASVPGCERIVLGDWYEQGSVLRVRDGEVSLDALSC